MSVSIENLKFTYPGADGFSFEVADLQLAAGQTHLLLGPSGSGKSTLLNLLAGTLRPDSGRLQVAGCDLTDVGPARMDRFRGEHIGFVFQTLNLIPWLTAHDNVALGLAFAPQRRARLDAPVKQAVEALLQRLNIDPATAWKPAGKLSIGQQQRVAAARALIGAPDLILADEPSSALDEANTGVFFDLLMAGLDRSRQTLLVVSHDSRLESRFDRVLSAADIIRNGGER